MIIDFAVENNGGRELEKKIRHTLRSRFFFILAVPILHVRARIQFLVVQVLRRLFGACFHVGCLTTIK